MNKDLEGLRNWQQSMFDQACACIDMLVGNKPGTMKTAVKEQDNHPKIEPKGD